MSERSKEHAWKAFGKFNRDWIVKSLTKLKRAGGGLRIASAQPMIVYSLKMTKLDTLIEMFPTADEAATGFEAGSPSRG